jgi:hypothetical protein
MPKIPKEHIGAKEALLAILKITDHPEVYGNREALRQANAVAYLALTGRRC